MTLLPILLQEGFVSKVSVGDKLTAGQIIAEKKDRGIDEVVHVASIFKISPKKSLKTLKKHLGDGVSKGDVVASKKDVLSLGSKKIISEFSGTVIKIDEEAGDVLIRTATTEESVTVLNSPVDGTVDFCNNEKIVIKTDKEMILAKNAEGQGARAEFTVLGENVDFNTITSEVSGKIVLGKHFEKGSIFKAFGLGAIGVIGVEIREGDFEDVREKGIKSPVVSIEGNDYGKLVKHKNREIYLDVENKTVVIL